MANQGILAQSKPSANTNTVLYSAPIDSSASAVLTVANDGNGNKFYFDGVIAPNYTFDIGATYTFDVSDSSNSGHPFRLSTTKDGTHGGGVEFTTGVAFNSGSVVLTVDSNTPSTLYYYCDVHSGMSNDAVLNSQAVAGKSFELETVSGIGYMVNGDALNPDVQESGDFSYAITGGADKDLFRVSDNGSLSFKDSAPDPSNPNDSNGDGEIDFLTENCTGFSINAAKRDNGSSNEYDFTGTIMGAYLEGRHLISNGGSNTEIEAQRTIIVNTWEKLLAANAIHYINDTIGDIGDGSAWTGTETAACTADTELCQNYTKHWSEMRGFAVGLHYNSFKQISDTDLANVYDLMGTAPVWIGDEDADVMQFKADLLAARDILQSAYGFDTDVVANW